MSAPPPNNRWAAELVRAGYWIFALRGHRKWADGWGATLDTGEQERCAAAPHDRDATGWALCPMPSDRVPLLVVDLDAYGVQSAADAWGLLVPDMNTLPDGCAVVRSASGGWHFYFRQPENAEIPPSFDLPGGGARGETRTSRSKTRALVVLPGSVAFAKQEKAARYTLAHGTLDPDSLADAPPELVQRLVSRAPAAAQGGVPTEVLHFLAALRRIPEDGIPAGERNTAVAQIAQIMGRLSPERRPPERAVSDLWDVLEPRLEGSIEQREFRTAVRGGWTTGRRNQDKWQPRQKHPTITEVKEECRALFGDVPWVLEQMRADGRTYGYTVGIGGSAKRPEEAREMVQVRHLRDVLVEVTRASATDPDAVVRSPLFIQPGWAAAFEMMLLEERAVERLGTPPEERFWAQLYDWAEQAIRDHRIEVRWTATQKGLLYWIVCPPDGAPCLLIQPDGLDTLCGVVGDVPAYRSLTEEHTLSRRMRGTTKPARYIPLTTLEQRVDHEHLVEKVAQARQAMVEYAREAEDADDE